MQAPTQVQQDIEKAKDSKESREETLLAKTRDFKEELFVASVSAFLKRSEQEIDARLVRLNTECKPIDKEIGELLATVEERLKNLDAQEIRLAEIDRYNINRVIQRNTFFHQLEEPFYPHYVKFLQDLREFGCLIIQVKKISNYLKKFIKPEQESLLELIAKYEHYGLSPRIERIKIYLQLALEICQENITILDRQVEELCRKMRVLAVYSCYDKNSRTNINSAIKELPRNTQVDILLWIEPWIPYIDSLKDRLVITEDLEKLDTRKTLTLLQQNELQMLQEKLKQNKDEGKHLANNALKQGLLNLTRDIHQSNQQTEQDIDTLHDALQNLAITAKNRSNSM